MAWQRKIPFGYRIEQGQACLHPVESNAVRDIFQLYLSGLSYSQIAREMERQKIKYHQHTEQWNKHMVKRILENQTYLGGRLYPRLIDGEDFLAARFQQREKAVGTPRPKEIDAIRKKAVCALCGAKMQRHTCTNGRSCWRCESPVCGSTVYMENHVLITALRECLMELSQAPYLLTPPEVPTAKGPSRDAIRIENELNLAFNRGAEDVELIRALIFASAAESYAAIPDPTPGYQLEHLCKQLEYGDIDDDILKELLETAVKHIRIGKDGVLELELINGKVVQQSGKEQPA
ncbi:recombinase family protein [uncultured Dysosmobacter sp.]|uniref:recombinase family protein n=1 Tax=uncultured Dysosmobacter sp. TaxID=2591384 RepID=UPI002612FA95|nr:recombinase family protein [uncultured Dysosmobacter sp.]